jgi:hypothetical protein
MRILCSIVAPSRAFMASCDSKFTGCSSIRSEVIRDELFWDKAIFLQQLAHEFQRRPLVPPALNQNIEDLAFGVHGAPQIWRGLAFGQEEAVEGWFVKLPSGFRSDAEQAQRRSSASFREDEIQDQELGFL